MAKRGERQAVKMEAKRDFFIQIPAFLEYLPDMDPYSWRLYIHYLRVCGEHDHCYEYTSTTAALVGMSERTIRYRRDALAKLNLIDYWHEGYLGHERVHIVIKDVWAINAQFSRLLQNVSRGDWMADWIRNQLGIVSPTGVNDLNHGKHTPAPDADPPAPDADPPAPDAAKERSLIQIPESDPYDDDALASPFVKEDRAAFRSVRADQEPQPESAALRLAAHRFGRLAFPNGGFDNLAGSIDGLSADRLNSFCAACYLSELKARRGDTKINDHAAFVRSMADKGKWPGFSPIEAEQFEQCMAAYVSGLESDIWEEFPESEYTQ